MNTLVVSDDGSEVVALAEGLDVGQRTLIGVAGAPGSGKSLLSMALVGMLGSAASSVPMDGFHLADVELSRQQLLDRKGAPETFDAWGFAALLSRLRSRPSYTVYAPGFERILEQPIAGAIAIEPQVDVVVTEGNYLLADGPQWRAVRAQLDEVWYVFTDEAVRRQRLLARHLAFGKTEQQAQAWIARVDEPNARLIEATRSDADLVVDLTAWSGGTPAQRDNGEHLASRLPPAGPGDLIR